MLGLFGWGFGSYEFGDQRSGLGFVGCCCFGFVFGGLVWLVAWACGKGSEVEYIGNHRGVLVKFLWIVGLSWKDGLGSSIKIQRLGSR